MTLELRFMQKDEKTEKKPDDGKKDPHYVSPNEAKVKIVPPGQPLSLGKKK